MNNLNFIDQTISIEQMSRVDKDRLLMAKKRGKSKSNINLSSPFLKASKAYELANNSCNTDLSALEKFVFISNVAFPNDKEFAKKIAYDGLDIEKLNLLNDLVNRIKVLRKNNKEININNPLLDEIIHISKVYFGITYPNIVINKINELLVLNPELFKENRNINEKILEKF